MELNDSLGISASFQNTTGETGLASGFPMQRQLMSNWCWSACTVGICQYMQGPILNQKQVVADVTQRPQCATSPPIPYCNVMADFGSSLSHYGRLGNSLGNPLNPDLTVQSLNSGRTPIGCQMYIPSLGGGHAVVIYGAFYDGGGNLVLRVADPADGALLTMPHSVFSNNYRNAGGRWMRTYLTR